MGVRTCFMAHCDGCDNFPRVQSTQKKIKKKYEKNKIRIIINVVKESQEGVELQRAECCANLIRKKN